MLQNMFNFPAFCSSEIEPEGIMQELQPLSALSLPPL